MHFGVYCVCVCTGQRHDGQAAGVFGNNALFDAEALLLLLLLLFVLCCLSECAMFIFLIYGRVAMAVMVAKRAKLFLHFHTCIPHCTMHTIPLYYNSSSDMCSFHAVHQQVSALFGFGRLRLHSRSA